MTDTMTMERFEDIENPDIDRLPSLGYVPGGTYRTRPSEMRVKTRAAAVKEIVAREYGVSVMDLESGRCGQKISQPRQAAMWLLRQTSGLSNTQIARSFNRDPTSAFHAMKAVEKRMDADPVEREVLTKLAAFIESQDFMTTENELLVTQIAERVTDAVTKRLRKLASMSGEDLLRELVPEYRGRTQ